MKYPYEDEEKIVWIRDHESLSKMAYVRENILLCNIRTGPVKPPEGEMLIGYAVLKKTALKVEERGFYRRIFTLKRDEIASDSKDLRKIPAQEDAVDPLSVRAGKPTGRVLIL